MNLRTAACLTLFMSLFFPWKIIWGTNITGTSTSWFYIFEFPFMVEYVTDFGSLGIYTSWEAYNSVPKYLGTMFVLLGVILCLWGTFKRKRDYFVEWGGIFSLIGMVLFAGSGYEEVYIPYMLYQTYQSLPLGMFIPVAFWLMILMSSQETGRYISREQSKRLSFFCGECGKEVSVEFDFCPFCGKPIQKVNCKNCGRKIPTQYTFCPYCGETTQRDFERTLIL
ncbi:zinc ribbon domain-containing protein [Candidatus Bathyarchaeota archaeon]|nr:zinc ribbon domain-containing protein [Candidatus Bathyarchaeota archaeon]